jgi:peptidoglycan/LPS O-acetylase OafA/YrhL
MSMTDTLSNERSLSLHDNGYDLVRLVLAVMVVYSHAYAVGGYGAEPLARFSKEHLILGELGVLGFFALSGFLVSASGERSRSFVTYFLKRSRRIFPGFWVCLAITAFAFAPLIALVKGGSLSAFPWTGENGALSYIARNFFLQIRQHSVGDVLHGLAWPGSINGSLWSLFPEFCCYIAVALLVVGGAFAGSRWLLTGVAAGAYIDHVLMAVIGADAFPGIPSFYAFTIWSPYLTAFAVGACAYAWREKFVFSWKTVGVLGLLCLITLKFGGFKIVSPLLVGALVLCAGSCFKMRLKTDLSYGIYIYSFPCQQLLFASGVGATPVPVFIVTSILLSAFCAWLSWNLVEKPALGRGLREGKGNTHGA